MQILSFRNICVDQRPSAANSLITGWPNRLRNHIVWDAVQVIETSRRHTARVRDFLDVVRTNVAELVEKRDVRRDGLVKVLERAMREKLGDDAEAVMKQLRKHGISNG